MDGENNALSLPTAAPPARNDLSRYEVGKDESNACECHQGCGWMEMEGRLSYVRTDGDGERKESTWLVFERCLFPRSNIPSSVTMTESVRNVPTQT